ncbi:outer membrane lipoprotein-sorting protein [Pontibacter ruber]|uniref:Outer membrane lipoprotein-sorting protein n=1 Tax=Pontibacter ruber TaxID=1343895 RepID=A0ABW5CT59_9BACT|nr:outer membrane lipoprotein-sorting protein [Pontibacter ruber]
MRKTLFTRKLLLVLLSPLLLFAASCTRKMSPESARLNDGTEVVNAMYQKWKDKWYPNFAFEQKAIFYENDQVTKEEVWQEIYSQPGNLHIRFNGFETGNGVLFAQDSVYNFANGELKSKRPMVHNLVLLSFDVYFLQPAVTAEKLQQLGFNLQQMTESTWQGRPVYVVGTSNAADTTTTQFWVDKERLYTVRSIINSNGAVRDVEINNYKQINNNWVATEIVFKTNGKKTLYEEYFNISFPERTDKSWFDPKQFSSARW